MSYIPKFNDYVTWKPNIEGWVYFTDSEYITIEIFVREKDDMNYRDCSLHRNERLLILCYRSQWKELKYIKTRKSLMENE
jgi:hypothetical protein